MTATNETIQARKNERLKTKLGWKIAHDNIAKLNGFKYLCFSFKFDIDDKPLMNELNAFVLGQKTPPPSDVCDFFIERDIAYTLKFIYDKNLTPRENLLLWHHVKKLNKQKSSKVRKIND